MRVLITQHLSSSVFRNKAREIHILTARLYLQTSSKSAVMISHRDMDSAVVPRKKGIRFLMENSIKDSYSPDCDTPHYIQWNTLNTKLLNQLPPLQ